MPLLPTKGNDMAGVTLPSLSGRTALQTQTLVESRAAQGDAWRLHRYASGVEARVVSLPAMTSATVRNWYGMALREDQASAARGRPIDLRGRQTRIRTRYGRNGSWVTRWTGLCPVEKIEAMGRDRAPTGRQEFHCMGIDYTLDAPVDGSVWLDGSTARTINSVSTFNEKGAGGTIRGNRSQNLVVPVDAYTFARVSDAPGGGYKWSVADIIRYLLAWWAPADGPTWVLTGQVEMLEQLKPVYHHRPNQTVREIINELCDRRRGVEARVVWTGGDVAEIRVSSVADADIRFGEYFIPKNPAVVDLDLESSDLLTEVTLTIDETQRVDEVIVRGGPLRVTFTMGVSEGNCVKGWSDEAETAYKNAGNSFTDFGSLIDDAPAVAKQIADEARGNSMNRFWRPVFRKMLLDPAWTWEFPQREVAELGVAVTGDTVSTFDSITALPATTVLPSLTAYGAFDTQVTQAVPWRIRRFDRTVGLYKGWNYATDPPARTGLESEREELEPPMVWIKAPIIPKTEGDPVVYRYVDVSRGDGTANVPRASVRLAEDELAVYVEAEPLPHAYARLDFLPRPSSAEDPTYNANPSNVTAVCDWRSLLMTVAVETNAHAEVWMVMGSSSTGRRVLIEVPSAEVWWVAPGTVLAVDDKGLTVRAGVATQAGIVTRDDRAWLRAVGALAQAWFDRPRAGVSATLKGIGNVPMPGTMLGNVNAALGRPVASYTTVMEVTYNFEQQETRFRAGYEGIDLVEWGVQVASEAIGGGGASSGAMGSGAVGSGMGNGGRVENLPVRWASGGGGASTSSGTGTGETTTVGIVVGYVRNFAADE